QRERLPALERLPRQEQSRVPGQALRPQFRGLLRALPAGSRLQVRALPERFRAQGLPLSPLAREPGLLRQPPAQVLVLAVRPRALAQLPPAPRQELVRAQERPPWVLRRGLLP